MQSFAALTRVSPAAGDESVTLLPVGFANRTSGELERESFPSLLARRAPTLEFLKWFRAYPAPEALSGPEWMELVPPVAEAVADLAWMTKPHRASVERCILDFVQHAFTVLWRPEEHSASNVRETLKGFVIWLESLPDKTVVRFCWDLLSNCRSFTPEPVWWLKHSGRLSGAISYNSLALAVALADEGDAMYWWPPERWSVVYWETGSVPYLELLNHSSYLVRASASFVLGRVFYGVHTETSSGRAASLSSILAIIRDREVITAGVAGPFLQGANWSIEPETWSSFGRDFDIKSWFMETLRDSAREPEAPHLQTLEFYAHELFHSDGNAIRKFLQMGRRELAVMTATEEPEAIPELLPLLREMSMSSDLAVASAIREYLSEEFHHAGLRHLHEPDTDSPD
ncbi:MAG: hypothetical protein H7039_09275 [Bryobacteraceae bacterium]|nr:hypothetical protein [Bryobacteraceae bacterium]